jgi:hypothetical protein
MESKKSTTHPRLDTSNSTPHTNADINTNSSPHSSTNQEMDTKFGRDRKTRILQKDGQVNKMDWSQD